MSKETPSITIVLQMPDGSVSPMAFVTYGRSPTLPSGAYWVAGGPGGGGLWYREDTDENIQAEIDRTFQSRDDQGRLAFPVAPVGWERCNREEIPQDRTFRDAWVRRNGKFDHDMPKAREIHLDRLRKQRKPLLEELDREWMRATGQKKNKEADDIEAKRQALRDAPDTLAPALEAATTTEELKAVKLPE